MKRQPESICPRTVRLAAVAAMVGAALISSVAHAQQNFELTPFGGWMWGGTLEYASGDVHFNAAPDYGGMLGREIRPHQFVELSYWYQGAEVIARPIGAGPDFKLMDLGTHYIQLGGTNVVPKGGKVRPFVTGGLGATIFSPSNAPSGVHVGTQTVFSIAVGGGLKIDMSAKVALRAQARLLLPMQFSSGSAWFGSGGSGGISIEGRSIAQGDATLGVVIKLGGSPAAP